MDDDESIYLPGGGLPSEEVVIQRAVRRIKLGLEEDAAIGYSLQRGGTFIRKPKSKEKLNRNKNKGNISIYTELLISRSALA